MLESKPSEDGPVGLILLFSLSTNPLNLPAKEALLSVSGYFNLTSTNSC
jgi:hypothetical protein